MLYYAYDQDPKNSLGDYLGPYSTSFANLSSIRRFLKVLNVKAKEDVMGRLESQTAESFRFRVAGCFYFASGA